MIFIKVKKMFFNIPLVKDIFQQKHSLVSFVFKLIIFVFLLMAFDRLSAAFLVKGLDRIFGFDQSAEILCLGNSRTALGIDKNLIEKELGVSVAKYARNGANVSDRFAMLQQYVEKQPSGIKILVYDVDAHIFTGEGLSKNSYTLFYPFMDSAYINDYIRKYATNYDYSIRHILKLRRFDLETCNLSLRGWLRKYDNLKSGTIDIERLRKQVEKGQIRHISFDSDNIVSFEETLKYAIEKNLYIVLLFIPTVDLYNQYEQEKYTYAIKLLNEYASNNDKVVFWDYSPFFCDQYELFYDPIHLNPQGQKLVTEKLIQDIQPFLSKANK